MLVANTIVKSFGGARAVDGASIEIRRGGVTGLIGPNGAGKTTLFNCLAGFYRIDSGSISLDGARIDGLAPSGAFRKGLARTFQIPRPFPAMSVLDNVTLAPPGQPGEQFWMNWFAPKSVAAHERVVRERALHWIDFVGLSHLAHEPASVLSGGQRKLLELARVLVAAPKLILLDEPGAGVNPTLLESIVEKIRALNKEGMTFLIIEHNMDLIMSLCDPVFVMAQGKMLTQGSARDIRSDPRVVDAYLGGVAA